MSKFHRHSPGASASCMTSITLCRLAKNFAVYIWWRRNSIIFFFLLEILMLKILCILINQLLITSTNFFKNWESFTFPILWYRCGTKNCSKILNHLHTAGFKKKVLKYHKKYYRPIFRLRFAAETKRYSSICEEIDNDWWKIDHLWQWHANAIDWYYLGQRFILEGIARM